MRSDARVRAVADTEVRAMLCPFRALRRLVRRCAVPRSRRLRAPCAGPPRGAAGRGRRPGPGGVPDRVPQVGRADRRACRSGLLVPDRASRRQQRPSLPRSSAGARASHRSAADRAVSRALGHPPSRVGTTRTLSRHAAAGAALGLRAVGDRRRPRPGDRPSHRPEPQHGLRPGSSPAGALAGACGRDDRARAFGPGAAALGLCQRVARAVPAGGRAEGARC